MSEQPSFPIPETAQADETTGLYIITFRDDAVTEGLDLLSDQTGIRGLANAADFPDSALDLSQIEAAGGAVFPTLGVAVVSLDEGTFSSIMTSAGEDSAILAIEPERTFYAISDGLSADYLRGYRDAVNNLYEKATTTEVAEEIGAQQCFSDDIRSTWGLKATKVMNSLLTGSGIKVAVLDTGMDLQHPDFSGRSIVSQSFVPGEDVQDGMGHGTHCIGTACGFKDLNGRRYGVARESTIYVGKVLSNAGSGAGGWILAGMEWAIANGCQVISMSLGNTNPTPSTAYETVGRRALQNGCLIVAAAGNHGPTKTVGQPANSPSIMAVAAVDNCLQVPDFSANSDLIRGAKVDIAAPGVKVYSSLPVGKGRYASWNGTSMATPHVAGIAALYAESTGKRGAELWQLLTSHAMALPLPSTRVGSGLVEAP